VCQCVVSDSEGLFRGRFESEQRDLMNVEGSVESSSFRTREGHNGFVCHCVVSECLICSAVRFESEQRDLKMNVEGLMVESSSFLLLFSEGSFRGGGSEAGNVQVLRVTESSILNNPTVKTRDGAWHPFFLRGFFYGGFFARQLSSPNRAVRFSKRNSVFATWLLHAGRVAVKLDPTVPMFERTMTT